LTAPRLENHNAQFTAFSVPGQIHDADGKVVV
jgi:hypothetical protein